jgi:hypothetical protein
MHLMHYILLYILAITLLFNNEYCAIAGCWLGVVPFNELCYLICIASIVASA